MRASGRFACLTDRLVIKGRDKGEGKLSWEGDRAFLRFIVCQCLGVSFSLYWLSGREWLRVPYLSRVSSRLKVSGLSRFMLFYALSMLCYHARYWLGVFLFLLRVLGYLILLRNQVQ